MYRIPIETIESVVLTPAGELEVIHRRPADMISFTSSALYDPTRPSPDSVWKDVYGVVDGRIELLRTVQGKHVPAQVVPESLEFPEA